jgi:protein-L-isoaspartate(D-aspartate) O-methyltransferase
MTDFTALRTAMVDCQVRPNDVTRYPIIDALLRMPREEFVPAELQSIAYSEKHIELSPGRVLLDSRTFSKMLDALDIQPDELVLDVGCGYGYSSAIVSRLAQAVVSIEEIDSLAQEAESSLMGQNIDNVVFHTGPLVDGVADHGPYDVILLQGGIEVFPETLRGQLKPGGRVAAIFVDGGAGVCRIGINGETGLSWRRAFDATAPLLPGFEAAKSFEF